MDVLKKIILTCGFFFSFVCYANSPELVQVIQELRIEIEKLEVPEQFVTKRYKGSCCHCK